ncbi:hypothetical protein Ppa06_58290 [Planomonospora parontospora subsp. parontospora]|uniref:Tape measure protein n=2 Tax=Planomonospora parontospora TaxID=58119 RepID=A0AA37BLE6_9ACTN|nr:hypothetical protein [Planomonospora parontospora]GGK90165.1 hypothetical protein GCM10010126_57020 [Planomonospora parontospora]GII12031.1 hypothetical protein Ppa06_58290 [Planomonospora parontospora subsp. parontospora]
MALNVGELFATIDLRDRLSAGLRRAIGNLRDAAREAGVHMRSIGGNATLMGASLVTSAAKFSVMASAMAVTGQGALSLGAALAPAAGIIAALPGAVALGAAALATLAVALSGVGEAFSTALGDDPAKFAEALAKLSPAARAAALEVRALKSAFDQLKSSVQDGLFAPLAGQISAVASVLGGPLQAGMTGVASAFGQAGVQVAEFLRSCTAVMAVNTIFASLRSAIESLTPAIQPLLTGFAKLAAVGAAFSATLAPGIAEAATRLGNFLSAAADSGQALGWMQGAVEVFRQLGSILQDVWGIVSGVFDAMRTSGGDALGVIGQLLDGLNAFVNSASGQQTLVAVFTTLGQVGQALLPVILAIASGIGAIAPLVGQLAQVVGPVLTTAINAIVPAISALAPGVMVVVGAIGQAVAAIGPTLTPIGEAISGVLVAVAPLIPVIGDLAALIASTLAAGVQAVTPALGPLVAAFGQLITALSPLIPQVVTLAVTLLNGLLPAITPLIPIVGQLIALFAGTFIQVLQIFAAALLPILPPLSQLAEVLAGVLMQAMQALMPFIVQLATAIASLLPTLTPLITLVTQVAAQLGQILVQAITLLVQALSPLIPVIVQATSTIGTALLEALIALMPSIMQIIDAFVQLLPVLTPIVGIVAQLVSAFAPLVAEILPVVTQLITALTPVVVQIVGAFGQLLAALMPVISVLADIVIALMPVVTWLVQVAAAILEKVIPVVGDLIKWVIDLAAKILAELTPVLQWVRDKIPEAWEWVKSKIRSAIEDIKSVINWFSELPDMLGRWMIDARDAVTQRFAELVDWLRGLPVAILNAIGNLGGLLSGLGHDLIIGLWNGIVGMWDWFKNAIWNFFSSIMPQWVKDALGIASPSKVFAEIGRFTMMGVSEGMLASQRGVLNTAAGIAGRLSKSFNPQLTASAGSTGLPVTGGARTAGTSIHVVNHYPQAEPTSTTVNRGLQYAGALGVV